MLRTVLTASAALICAYGATADTISLTPVDAQAITEDGVVWTIDPDSLGLNASRFDTIPLQRRGLMEFPLDAIPAGSTIISASFSANVWTFTHPPDPVLLLHGYAGDGILDLADATRPTNQIGASDPVTALGPIELSISPTYIESLLGASTHLGVWTMVEEAGQCAIDATDAHDLFGAPAPTLTIEFVPEPTTVALMLLGATCVFSRQRRV